jgi:beta-glucosidase
MVFSTAPDGTVFRDLNGNGVLDPYEDPGLPVAERVRDLLSRMTVEEKAGLLFHPQLEVGPDGSLVKEGAIFLPRGTTSAIEGLHLSHLLGILLPEDAAAVARWHNRLQEASVERSLSDVPNDTDDPLYRQGHHG